MPMHPSTQVTHIPLNGLTDPSVLFFVSVAAVAFTFVNDILNPPDIWAIYFTKLI